MPDLRLFIAVELPKPVLLLLEHVQTELARAVPRGSVRWVRPEGIHLTLKFLGNTPDSNVLPISQVLDSVAQHERPLRLSTGTTGFFPPRGALRVLWLGVSGQVPELAAVQRRLDMRIMPLGFPPEDRPFAPHLTLGRVGDRSTPDVQRTITAALARLRPDAQLPISIEGFTLFESQPQPGGSVYRALHHAAFPSPQQAAGN